jgi:hypothetical protein
MKKGTYSNNNNIADSKIIIIITQKTKEVVVINLVKNLLQITLTTVTTLIVNNLQYR